MFTGLVAAIGSVTTLDRGSAGARIEFDSALARELAVGDSVAVNGVCLSATDVDGSSFTADIVAETLARTTLGELTVGSQVNLELPLRASDRLGGHDPYSASKAAAEIVTAAYRRSFFGDNGPGVATARARSRSTPSWRATSSKRARSRSTASA